MPPYEKSLKSLKWLGRMTRTLLRSFCLLYGFKLEKSLPLLKLLLNLIDWPVTLAY